jgi:hypothetical protein
VRNETDFLRSETKGMVDVVTEAIRQGRSQQLWLVTVTRCDDGQELARTQVRLHDVAPPTGNPPRRSEEGTPRSGARRHGGYPGLTVPSAGSAGAGSCSPMWS